MAAPSLKLDSLFQEMEAEERRERDEARRAAAKAAARQEAERRHFEERPLTEADRALFLHRIRAAFADHEREVMLVSFPSAFCRDDGRSINHQLDGWEEQLPGYARRIFEFWRDDLRLGGFGLQGRIVSFENGMPGDVGLFVTWPEIRPGG
jgi:hypothetical protein